MLYYIRLEDGIPKDVVGKSLRDTRNRGLFQVLQKSKVLQNLCLHKVKLSVTWLSDNFYFGQSMLMVCKQAFICLYILLCLFFTYKVSRVMPEG